MKYILGVLLAVVSLQSWGAATIYEQDWEMATVPRGADATAAGLAYQGVCFWKNTGADFNSAEISTKYKRKGSKSVRLETNSRFTTGGTGTTTALAVAGTLKAINRINVVAE